MNTNNNTEKILINNLIEQLTKLNDNINELDKNIKKIRNTDTSYSFFNVLIISCACVSIVSILCEKTK